MATVGTLQVGERGVLAFPSRLRRHHGIDVGDTYRLLDFDGTLVLVPLRPMVPELADEIDRLRLEAGVSIATLIHGLREQRARYVAEHYGEEPAADTE